jgi:hypothetical protein
MTTAVLHPPSSSTATFGVSTAAAPASPRRRLRTRLGTEQFVFAVVGGVVYLVVGLVLDLVYRSYFGDAVSRLANAFYVLHSRDPHLAAIGFVWNPLPSFVELPLLLFSTQMHFLTSEMVAGSICSAIEMAGAVYQMHCALREWGVKRGARVVLTLLFALNPMVIVYGANGMSEAMYLFTLIMTSRYLMRWLRRGDTKSLVYAGTALALAYLTRYEAIGSALAAGVLVAMVGFKRADGNTRGRLIGSVTDFVVFALPAFTSFVAWAIISFVIVGSPFEQLSGVYGNSSQSKVAADATSALHFHGRLILEAKSVGGLAPLLPLLIILTLIVAILRRDSRVAAPFAVIGGALGFDVLSYLSGGIGFFLRYFITAIPLGIFLVAGLLVDRAAAANDCIPIGVARPSRPSADESPIDGAERSRLPRAASGFLAVLVALVLAAPSIPTTILAMTNPTIGSLERQALGVVFDHPLTPEDLATKVHWKAVQNIANYIAGMHLRNGDMIADTFGQCTPDLILHAANPRVFVITNDRDFQRVLADPLAFDAHYLLVPQPVGTNVLDAITRLYPSMYANGDGFATLVHTFPPLGGCAPYRIYRVIRGAPDA